MPHSPLSPAFTLTHSPLSFASFLHRPVPLHTTLEVEARVEKVAGELDWRGVLRVFQPAAPHFLTITTPHLTSCLSSLLPGVKITVTGSIRDPATGAELASCVAVLADLVALRRAGV